MALTITPKLQKALDIASSIEEVVSVQAIEPPQHILDQIENKDSVYLDFVVQKESGKINFAIVVPNVFVENIDDSLNIPIRDLLNHDNLQIDIVFDNIGKITYYVRESDQYLIKLIDAEAPTAFVQSDNLKKLVEKLEQQDKVNKIVVEEIVDSKLKESLEAERPVIIKAYIDINNDKIIDHFVSFAVTELVYDIETSHDWAVNNLMDLIEKNNAE